MWAGGSSSLSIIYYRIFETFYNIQVTEVRMQQKYLNLEVNYILKKLLSAYLVLLCHYNGR